MLAGKEPADRRRLIVLLHVPRAGRLADEMARAVGCLRGLANVWLDTAMVMDPTVLQIMMEEIGPERLLFATGLPVAAMRGRRVYVMDHWVDLVLPGPQPSAHRVASPDMRASFMVYETILAIRRAAERAKIAAGQLRAIFHDNGARLLERVEA